MFLAVSPYHLTTREAPAMAALLLAERVITFLPTPFGGAGKEQVTEAARRIPRYVDFMKSWEWAVPLWERGLIASVFEGQDAVDEVRRVCRRIQRDPALADLRSVVRPGLFDNEDDYLEAVTRDLLRAGPDPSVSVPVVAGLDRFAVRLGLIAVRPEAASVAQRAEMQQARPILSVAVSILIQAGAEAILETRVALEEVLVPLRDAVAVLAAELTGEQDAPPEAVEAVRRRARDFSEAFGDLAADGGLDCDDDDVRTVHAQANLTLTSLPVDAVLGSSLAAMAVLSGAPRSEPGDGPGRGLAEHDPLAGQRVLSLIVRTIGHRPPRR